MCDRRTHAAINAGQACLTRCVLRHAFVVNISFLFFNKIPKQNGNKSKAYIYI